MESMFAVFDGEYLFGLFPYEEDALTVADNHRKTFGNSNMVVQVVKVPYFEFPVRK